MTTMMRNRIHEHKAAEIQADGGKRKEGFCKSHILLKRQRIKECSSSDV